MSTTLLIEQHLEDRIMKIVFGVILIISALALVVSVLLQGGKNKSLSSAIAGGSDTYYGKNKAKTIDKKLSVITTIVAIVFAVVVLLSFIIQDDADLDKIKDAMTDTEAAVTTVADTAENTAEDTAENTSAADTTAAAADSGDATSAQ